MKSLKEELDFKAKLDRSDTDEIKTAVSTTTHSLIGATNTPTGPVRVLSIAALVVLITVGGIALYKFWGTTRIADC